MTRPVLKSHSLLDWLLAEFGFKNDLAVCGALGIHPANVSKVRNGHIGVSDTVILAIHERLDVPVKTIRERMAA